MPSLTDDARMALEARVADLAKAREAIVTEEAKLAGTVREHIAAHEAEVVAAKATLSKIVGDSEHDAAKIPGIVFAAERKAESWLQRNGKALIALVIGVAVLVVVIRAVL